MSATRLKELLEAEFPEAQVEAEGGDGKFLLTLVSERFAGLSRVKRQQLVYAVINDLISDGTVHAVVMKTHTPEEWRESAA